MTDDQPPLPEPRHVGDGVYVSFDGYQIWLAVNHHRHRVVALEPGVLERVVDFAREINAAAGHRRFAV